MTYLRMVLSIFADDPLSAVFCIGMAIVGVALLIGAFT